MKSRLEPHTPPPDSIVDDVLYVLAHRVFRQYWSVLTEYLPAELRPAWEAAMRAAVAADA